MFELKRSLIAGGLGTAVLLTLPAEAAWARPQETAPTAPTAPADDAVAALRERTAAGATRATRSRFHELDASSSGVLGAKYNVTVFGSDEVTNDAPGLATTTLRVYGDATARETGSATDVQKIALRNEFTCTGAGIGGLSIGSGGVSVSGGSTSSTLTWSSSRTSVRQVTQLFDGAGHFRCKASNATSAKFTHRLTAVASYKTLDVRAQDEYSHWW